MIAHIVGGRVVNISVAPASAAEAEAWMAATSATVDHFLVVDSAGVGWEEYEAGRLRPPAPTSECVWDDENGVWDCPAIQTEDD